MAQKEKEVQSLQERVIELQRQLAEAQAVIQTLTERKQDSQRTASHYSYEQTFQELKKRWEEEKANLLASEERLQSALMIVPHPLMIGRDDGQIVMINAAWAQITGYSPAEIPTIDEWTRKAFGKRASESGSEILSEGFAQNGVKKWGEFEITTRSGEKRIWDFNTTPLGVDPQGRRLTMAMAVDITERRKSEEQLRAARDQATWLARLPGENPNPVMRVSDQGIVLYCNPPAASLRGWRCEVDTMLSSPLLDLVELTIEQDQVVEQDVALGDKFYSVSVIPLLKQGYLNLYGRDVTERKQAEKALEESEHRQREITRLLELDQSRLAAILRHLPVGVWIVDEQGQLMGSNPEAERIWAGEAPVDGPADYQKYVSWHPGSGELLKPEEHPMAVALRSGQPVPPMETNIRRFDGSEGTVLVSAVPVKDAWGKLIGVVAVNVDITERKQMEEALRKSEERFAKAFHASPDAVIISRLSDGLVMEVNDGWSTIFGHKPNEVIGHTTLELGVYAKPGDRQIAIAQLREKGFLRDYEVQIRRKSGELRQVGLSAERIEIHGEECLLAIIQDITERKQADEALRESEQRFHSLADSMPQLIWTARPDGTVDYYNQRQREYKEIRQVEGAAREWAPVLHAEDSQRTLEAWQHSVATGEIYQIEHRVQTADGSYRWHLSRGVPVRDESGHIIRWYGTSTDIHDLKMAEEQLKVYAKHLESSNREIE